MKTRSTFRRRSGAPDNTAYRARKEDHRRAYAEGRKPTGADMARLRESRHVQDAKAGRRSAAWTGARV